MSERFDPISYASMTIRIDGKPVPKGRPRMSRNGGVFTPKTTVDYENKIAAAWREKFGDRAFGGKVEVFLYFGSKFDYKQDVDNLAKSALDGLQKGGAFANGDEQVYRLIASKFPATDDKQHTIIVIRNLAEPVMLNLG